MTPDAGSVWDAIARDAAQVPDPPPGSGPDWVVLAAAGTLFAAAVAFGIALIALIAAHW